MDRVGGEVDRAARLYEVVKSYAELRREVPDASAAGLAVRHQDIRRIFVCRVDQSARALNPRGEVSAGLQIPAENDGRDADTGEGSAAVREIGILRPGRRRCIWSARVRRGRERLPVGHDLDGVFKLAAQDAGRCWIGEHLAGATSGGEKAEVGPVAGPDAALKERAELPGIVAIAALAGASSERFTALCRVCAVSMPKGKPGKAKEFARERVFVRMRSDLSAKERPPKMRRPR